MKIALCIPWQSPFIFTGFWDGNANLHCPEGCTTRWFRGEGYSPARRHISLCEKALDKGWAETLPELSMGMSDDFEQALLEGATILRVGRALFAEVTV